MSFEEWFLTVVQEVDANCENRMDSYDAEDWMLKAYKAGFNEAERMFSESGTYGYDFYELKGK